MIVDEALRGRRDMVTGANVDDVHLRGVEVERDISVGSWADLREVAAGEPCPNCGEPLELLPALEVGHIFKLGYKFTKAFGVTVLDASGERVHPIMGSYGIGVERAMAAVVECHHDERGIIWPVAVAPFTVVVTVAQSEDPESAKAGSRCSSSSPRRASRSSSTTGPNGPGSSSGTRSSPASRCGSPSASAA